MNNIFLYLEVTSNLNFIIISNLKKGLILNYYFGFYYYFLGGH